MSKANTGLKDYRGWSFWNRSFLTGLALSLLWHFFWFFSIKIVVATPRKVEHSRPYLVSLGPVMDDAIFKTLVETRPELSRSFYRRPSDFSSATDIPAPLIERRATGGIVSVPFGKKFIDSLKEIVGGIKATPDFEWTEEEKRKRLRLAQEMES